MLFLIAFISLATPIESMVQHRIDVMHSRATPAQAVRIAHAVEKYSAEYNVPPEIIVGIIERESTFSPIVVSKRGCVGLMQLSPTTAQVVAKELGIIYYNLKNVEHNIRLGTKYLASLYAIYKDWDTAMAAYNMGPGKLKKMGVKRTQYSRDVRKNIRAQKHRVNN